MNVANVEEIVCNVLIVRVFLMELLKMMNAVNVVESLRHVLPVQVFLLEQIMTMNEANVILIGRMIAGKIVPVLGSAMRM